MIYYFWALVKRNIQQNKSRGKLGIPTLRRDKVSRLSRISNFISLDKKYWLLAIGYWLLAFGYELIIIDKVNFVYELSRENCR